MTRPLVLPSGAVEGDGDQRGERGTADLREGVADGDTGVADLGAEHQGEQRSGGATGRGHRHSEDQHQGEGEQPRVAGVDQRDRRDQTETAIATAPIM